MRYTLAIALLAVICLPLSAHAHTLQVRVVEVQDGKTIIVENTKRRFKIVLKGADAPELDQPAGDVARQHLADLVLYKEVAVEATGLGADSLVIAKVFSAGVDISQQMIRDGVAWYDRSYQNEMSEVERRLYVESEQAARSERRGIWQDAQPTPPWEWRQAKARAAQPSSVPIKSSWPAAMPRVKKSPVSSPEDSKWKWPLFSPPGAPFSLRIPGGGHRHTIAVETPEGQTVTANYYWTQHLKIGYLTMWASGPASSHIVSALFERTQYYLNQAAAAHNLPCEFTRKKDANFNGYIGQRYEVQGCYFHGGIRLYYKVEGKTLTIYMVGVMGEDEGDPAINQFLESLVFQGKL